MKDFRTFLKRFRATRPFTLTNAGWVFILYTIGVGAGAINTGNNLLYLAFGVFLGLIIASGALSDMSLWTLDADILWPKSVTAGAPAMIPVRVINRKKRLPSICATLELTAEIRGQKIVVRGYVPYLKAGESMTLHLLVKPEERGWFHVRSLRFTTRYPFGLLHKRWTVSAAPAFDGTIDRTDGTFVYPSAHGLEGRARPPATAGAMPVGASGQRGEGDTIFGLREFRDSDSPRRIDWKASAKRAGQPERVWLVRETERDRESEIALLLDAPAFAALAPERREAAIRFAAAVVARYAREGHRLRLFVAGADGRRRRVSMPAGVEGDAELEFLSLWEPAGADTSVKPYLSPAAEHEAAARAIDLLAASDGRKAA